MGHNSYERWNSEDPMLVWSSINTRRMKFLKSVGFCLFCSFVHPKLGAHSTQSAMNYPLHREAINLVCRLRGSVASSPIRCTFRRFRPVVSSDRSPLTLLERFGTNSAFEQVRLWQGFCITIPCWWWLLLNWMKYLYLNIYIWIFWHNLQIGKMRRTDWKEGRFLDEIKLI